MLDTNYSGLSTGDFIMRMVTVAEKMEGHACFPDDCPEYVTRQEKLLKLADRLRVLDDAVAGGDTQKAAEKKALRAESEQCLIFNAQHIVMLSMHRKDPQLLLNAGYDLKQKSYNRKAENVLPNMPAKFFVKNGKVSGSILATVNRAQNVGSIELQVTDGDPLDESSWKTMPMFYHCRMEVTGLEPVKKYHFRTRYHNSGGFGPWSLVVALVVI